MTYRGDDIKRLIPQRYPIVMIDTAEERDGNSIATTLAVRQDNYFVLPDSTLSETGLIEHIAQSSSALAGCRALAEQSLAPPVGIIGEIKNFVCHRRPGVGELIETTATFNMSFGNVTMATGQSKIGEEVIAEIQLKIFIQ
ncbi:MAG: beta-hydroxyacyl-ACP dehydratase [Prevotella sp.]|nr:beta-hydroxyacyl-ACP dehydratase [Prevotella sp.]